MNRILIAAAAMAIACGLFLPTGAAAEKAVELPPPSQDARGVTQVTPLAAFHAAEAYHQDHATLHPDSPYIANFDLPKIANLKATMPQLYRDKPVLVSAQPKA